MDGPELATLLVALRRSNIS